MADAPTLSAADAAYVAAQEAFQRANDAQGALYSIAPFFMLGAIIVMFWLTFKEWRERKCGRHTFEARYDNVYVDGKWQELRYVRDVCTHCGELRERKSSDDG